MSRLTINSNILSLNAQRQFGQHTKSLESTFTRLSSGLRINKSADDAAGLAVSESLKVDTRIANQGVRNLNDGVSLLSIADSALGELSNVVIRLRELASQSASGTLGNKQRSSLDQEAQALVKEYNRIARSTTFNGRALFDGDFGRLSLAAGGSRNTLIESGLGGGIGDGTFLASNTYDAGASPYATIIDDFNRDGIPDIASTNYLAGTITIMLGNGDGTFKGRASYTSNNASERGSVIESRDLNNDGILDIVTSNGNSPNITVYIGNGNGSFSAGRSYFTGVAATVTSSFKLDDFNNDGVMDAVVTGSNLGGFVGVLFGNGDGSFKTGISYATGGDPGAVGTGDFNNDGIRDLVVGSVTGEDGIRIFFGNGNGTFKSAVTYAAGFGYGDVAVGDFNNDGFEDIAKTNSSETNLTVILGNGDGTFKAAQTYAIGPRSYEIVTGDLNGDGITDIIAADWASDCLEVFLGNSNGTFKAMTTYSGGATAGVHKVAIGDLNNDGVLDLVSANLNAQTVGVFLANANNGVSALQAFSLKTKFLAQDAMNYLENAHKHITRQRGQIGAFQSRVDVAVSVLKTTSLNYSEANSRITDADVAEESANLTKLQILQKASSSVLAQANLQPKIALSLLKTR